MKRQEKYPETATFHYVNENSKNRITGDCVIRALVGVTDEKYSDIVRELAELSIQSGYSFGSDETVELFLTKRGFTREKQPKKT